MCVYINKLTTVVLDGCDEEEEEEEEAWRSQCSIELPDKQSAKKTTHLGEYISFPCPSLTYQCCPSCYCFGPCTRISLHSRWSRRRTTLAATQSLADAWDWNTGAIHSAPARWAPLSSRRGWRNDDHIRNSTDQPPTLWCCLWGRNVLHIVETVRRWDIQYWLDILFTTIILRHITTSTICAPPLLINNSLNRWVYI